MYHFLFLGAYDQKKVHLVELEQFKRLHFQGEKTDNAMYSISFGDETSGANHTIQ